MKPRNLRYYNTDRLTLEALQKEYQDYGDRDTSLVFEEGRWVLTIYALDRRLLRKRAKAKKDKRDKRMEKFARRAKD